MVTEWNITWKSFNALQDFTSSVREEWKFQWKWFNAYVMWAIAKIILIIFHQLLFHTTARIFLIGIYIWLSQMSLISPHLILICSLCCCFPIFPSLSQAMDYYLFVPNPILSISFSLNEHLSLSTFLSIFILHVPPQDPIVFRTIYTHYLPTYFYCKPLSISTTNFLPINLFF